MILYEVTAVPEPELRDDYEHYMRETHIRDVLATGCFVGAHLAVTGSGRYRTTYLASAKEHLDRYLERHAHRLRADFAARFRSGVALSREVWSVVEEWER
jgi:Domain of unknown function (DUF4286)